jgi:hypothetical protein
VNGILVWAGREDLNLKLPDTKASDRKYGHRLPPFRVRIAIMNLESETAQLTHNITLPTIFFVQIQSTIQDNVSQNTEIIYCVGGDRGIKSMPCIMAIDCPRHSGAGSKVRRVR